MPAFLLGVVALLLLLWAASAFIKADPKEVARAVRWIGGGVPRCCLPDFCCFAAQLQWPFRSDRARSTRLDILLADSFRGTNTKKRGADVPGPDDFP